MMAEQSPSSAVTNPPGSVPGQSPVTTIRAEIAGVETTLAGLHDAVSHTALAAYGAPGDTDLRRDADQALASLREANDRLQQLRAAADLVERQEADRIEAEATAERQRAKDRLIRDRDRLQKLADEEQAKHDAAAEKLPAAQAEVADLDRRWRNATVAVEVLLEQRDNAAVHTDELLNQVEAIEQEIADFPVTAAEVEAAEARRLAEAEADTVSRARQAMLDRIAAEQAAHDAETVDVEPTRVPHGGHYIGWTFSSGLVIRVPRGDLPRLAAEKVRREEADAAAERSVRRNPLPPWATYQGAPYGFGREMAIRCWSGEAPAADLTRELNAAQDREDVEASDILRWALQGRRHLPQPDEG